MPPDVTADVTVERAPVICPHCGHTQLEPLAVITTVCRQCRGAIQVRDAAGSPRRVRRPLASLTNAKPLVDVRQLNCFDCGTVLTVPVSAESTMCKRCSSHIDLRDYIINQAVSKNFRTHGRFVVKEKGYVFNTDSVVGDAVLIGRFHGRLVAKHTLEIHSGAEIKGSFQAEWLVIPAGHNFGWSKPLEVGSVEIAGELSAAVQAKGTVRVRGSGRLFGNVIARDLVVESGAVVVGGMRVGASQIASTGSLPGNARRS